VNNRLTKTNQLARVKNKNPPPKKTDPDDSGQWPVLAVRVPHDVKRTLANIRKSTKRKFQPTEFVRAAIEEKLKRTFSPTYLRKHGYIYMEGPDAS